jgi:hypothetical protein
VTALSHRKPASTGTLCDSYGAQGTIHEIFCNTVRCDAMQLYWGTAKLRSDMLNPDDGGSMFLRNVGILQYYYALLKNQKTVIRINSTVKTSNLTQKMFRNTLECNSLCVFLLLPSCFTCTAAATWHIVQYILDVCGKSTKATGKRGRGD